MCMCGDVSVCLCKGRPEDSCHGHFSVVFAFQGRDSYWPESRLGRMDGQKASGTCLSLFSQSWDCKQLCLAFLYTGLGLELRASCLQGKYFTDWATSPSLKFSSISETLWDMSRPKNLFVCSYGGQCMTPSCLLVTPTVLWLALHADRLWNSTASLFL